MSKNLTDAGRSVGSPSAASRIRLLPEITVNRIAAGEVIERPAAAVKELVENALDAGARRISVVLAGGGIDRIEVTDDGFGMTAEELGLCVLRHATSKLADDSLTRIDTLGFRGEALPSIGAAARLEITSRTREPDAGRMDHVSADAGQTAEDRIGVAEPGQVQFPRTGIGHAPVGHTPVGHAPVGHAPVGHAQAGHAWSITVEGGAVSEVVPASGAPGTRIVVRDLFFATPARRKFLKNPRTEAEHAETAVRRLAMAAPGTAFRLENEGRVIFDLPAQERAPRVAALLGAEAAAAMVPVREVRTGSTREFRGTPRRPPEGERLAGNPPAEIRGDMVLSGYMCAPSVSRMTGAAQGLIVNGRPVADPVLKTAVRVAYRDVIAHGRHPVVALWLDLPPEELDVNVHPAKTELRFRDPAAVRSLVIGALGRVLSGAAGRDIPGPGMMGTGMMVPGSVRPGLVRHRPSQQLGWPGGTAQNGIRALPLPGFPPLPGSLSGPAMPPGVSEAALLPAYGPDMGWPFGQASEPSSFDGRAHDGGRESDAAAGAAGWNDGSPAGVLNFAASPAARTVHAAPQGAHYPGHDYPLGAAVAQVLDTYIIAVAADGTLILVDQHAAHERLTHEAIRARMLDGGAPSQPLLLPAVVDLPEADARRLLERAGDLARLGLEIESFGAGAVLVRALPAALGTPEPAPLIRDIADELTELDETTALAARLDAVIARIACHGSIRAGRRLGLAEMDALLRQMEATPRAATCSHGRPTFLRLSKAELETMFGRR